LRQIDPAAQKALFVNSPGWAILAPASTPIRVPFAEPDILRGNEFPQHPSCIGLWRLHEDKKDFVDRNPSFWINNLAVME